MWLLPLEVPHGDPSLSAGGGARVSGRAAFEIEMWLSWHRGLWRMAMTAAFVRGSASFGSMGSE